MPFDWKSLPDFETLSHDEKRSILRSSLPGPGTRASAEIHNNAKQMFDWMYHEPAARREAASAAKTAMGATTREAAKGASTSIAAPIRSTSIKVGAVAAVGVVGYALWKRHQQKVEAAQDQQSWVDREMERRQAAMTNRGGHSLP